MSKEFIDAVREGNWSAAHLLVREGAVSPSLETPSSSVYEWLVEVNAPPELISDLLRLHPASETLHRVKCSLMEACLRASATKSNAFGTFALLLAEGVSPNLIVDGGSTLLQQAMELNRVREVRELLRHGVDPSQMSVFGRESTSNIDEAARLTNEAAKLVLEYFGRAT
jgi:ankyrin repeat protein